MLVKVTGGRPLGVLQPGDPEQVGAYLVRARVGAGGMGVVYLAESPNGRPVALKVIHAALVGDSTFRERFRREVAAAKRIRSRVTVAVVDADPDAEQPWVAFEYVEGPDLQQVVEAALPRLSAAIGILTGIAEALVAIHQVGIVHRDLKPSNVLCPPGGVKVIDLGIAAVLEATTPSRTGFMGTPAWMAPEQVTAERLTPAVDVFAWGCIALYTLTGRLAFGGAEDSPHALVDRVVNAEPDLTGVPDELIDPVSASLARRPEDRPAIGEIVRMVLPSRRLNPPPVGALAWPLSPDAVTTPAPPDPGAVGGSGWPPLPVAPPPAPATVGPVAPTAAGLSPPSSAGPPLLQPPPPLLLQPPPPPPWIGPAGAPRIPGPSPAAAIPAAGARPGGAPPPPAVPSWAGGTLPAPPGLAGSAVPTWAGGTPPAPPGWAGSAPLPLTPPGLAGPAPFAPPGWAGAPPPPAPPGRAAGAPSPPAPPRWAPGAPPPVPAPQKRRRPALAIGLGVAIVALIVGVAVALGGSHETSVQTTVPTIVATTPGSTTSSTNATPPGLTPVAQLLPHDVDPAADCNPNQSPPNLAGLTSALVCSPKNLPGGQIFAFQFDTAADLTTSLAELNKFKGFDSASAGTNCPPGANRQDAIGWHSNSFPSHPGQILECLSVGKNNSQPDYIWTYPSGNVIIDAQAAEHSSFTDLDNWWTKDAPPP